MNGNQFIEKIKSEIGIELRSQWIFEFESGKDVVFYPIQYPEKESALHFYKLETLKEKQDAISKCVDIIKSTNLPLLKTVHQNAAEIHISNKSLVDFSKNWVIVIYEEALADNSNSVIGVANNRGSAMRIIQEHYGEDAKIDKPRIIEDSGLNFDVSVIVKDPMWGGKYRVTGMDFEINKL